MKRIGIITIQKCNNYGADLQAYALAAKLRAMGYEAENIDYLFYKHPRHLGGKMGKPVLPISWKNRVKEFLFPIKDKIKRLKNNRGVAQRERLFQRWFDANVKTGREYRSVDELYRNPPEYDLYMVGSDQVWNPRLYSNIKPYFLDFAPKGARCVSYASSLGVGELKAGVYYRYKQWLKKFSHIGLREKPSFDLVKSMGLDADVEQVLDPTMLFTAEEWAKVAQRPEVALPEKYVLVYELLKSRVINEVAEKLAAKAGCQVVRMGDGAYGPGEFVWLFAHAEAVVTNSFHGTVFSILHQKPFYSIIPQRMNNSGRIYSLLKLLGLEQRAVREADGERIEDIGAVDYGAAFARLEVARAKSLEFLTRAIENVRSGVKPKLPLKCQVAMNASDTVREASTSGGAFRAIADYVIEQGGVVFGAAFSDDFHQVRHIAAYTKDELSALQRSKYVWSDPTNAYKETVALLKAGRKVLFCGTPCQIAAIKKLARGMDDGLITIDIVCHGTPRADMFEAYIKELEAKHGGNVIKYDFRNKRLGWNFPRVEAEFSQGRGYDMILRNDPWYLGFGLNATLRKGCFECPFANLERVADFTIADCWRVASSHPEWDDNKGTSMVLVNSEKADRIWRELVDAGKVKCRDYDLDLAQMRNMPLMQKTHRPGCYDAVQKMFDDTGSFAQISKFWMSRKARITSTVKYWVKKLGWFYFRRKQ